MRIAVQPTGLAAARAELAARLRSRRAEIEAAVAARIYSLADPSEIRDPRYVTGLRAALSTALEYGIASIELGERRTPQVPPALAAQARVAARNGVGLATVLRRYVVGYTRLAEFALREAEAAGLVPQFPPSLLLQGQGAVFDRVFAEVSAEFSREEAARCGTREQRRAERISRLLAGEAIDPSDLDYDFGSWHVGAVGAGESAAKCLRGLARKLDLRPLILKRVDGTAWAWFCSGDRPDRADLCEAISAGWPEQMPLALGEPACGTAGWRLSHRQALSAFPIAQANRTFVRYADVALVVSTLKDDLLATSLRQLYLAPLEGDRGDGTELRDTLRAYLSARRNASATAAALGVSRQTVNKRLRTAEKRLGRYLDECMPEIEAMLRLDELELLPELSDTATS
jgi:hypothetical protein